MSSLKKFALLTLSSLSWFTLLVSLSFTMFAWRVDNEPGATSIPQLHYLAAATFLAGFLLTVLVHYIVARRKEKFSSIWWANLVATILYMPIFFLTLLMMV
jgi:hypothetical protein